MFGLGMPEILMILAIALIVIGPKKLPDLAKTLGRAMGEFKRSAQDFKRSIDIETTVTDLEDVADPKIDLEGIIKDANSKDDDTSLNEDAEPEPADTDAADAETVDKKIFDENAEPRTDTEPDKASDKNNDDADPKPENTKNE